MNHVIPPCWGFWQFGVSRLGVHLTGFSHWLTAVPFSKWRAAALTNARAAFFLVLTLAKCWPLRHSWPLLVGAVTPSSFFAESLAQWPKARGHGIPYDSYDR